MMRRLTPSILLCTAMIVSLADTVEAQRRAGDTFYLKARVGLTWYIGDNDENPDSDLGQYFSDGGLIFGGEFGYQFSPGFGLGLTYMVGDYPTIEPFPKEIDAWTNRHMAQLLFNLHLFPQAAISPYLLFGGHLLASHLHEPPGFAEERAWGFGPTVGLGFDIALGSRVGLFLETHHNFTFPDEAADQREDDPDRPDFDLLSFWGGGLRLTFRPAFVAVEIISMEGPEQLEVNEVGSFSVAVNPNATRPVNVTWNFGDGTTATGMAVTHSYDRPGTYTVTATASNPRSEDRRSMTVTVVDAPVPAEIVAINYEPREPFVGDRVTFRPQVRGTQPITYQWDFGDGTTATTETATHTYTEAGTYTVTLRVDNTPVVGPEGTDERTVNVTVRERPVVVEELNTVFFDFDRADLDAEAQSRLRENIEELMANPNICVRIDAYTDHVGTDQYNLRLSERRARAVEQFYIDNNISANRLLARGLGKAPVPCAKGEDPGPGCRRNRRAESIPVSCDELQQQ